MPCPIEIRKVIESSIDELLPNPDAIVSQSNANKVVKELNTMWSSAIARAVPYSGEGGAYVKINPLEDAIDKEYKRQLAAEKEFERDFNFFRGDQALMEQEQRDLFLQKSPTAVKPGVEELFQFNPELANVVYKTVGFDTNEFSLVLKNEEENPEGIFGRRYDIINTGNIIGNIFLPLSKNYIIKGIRFKEQFLNKGLGKAFYKWLGNKATVEGVTLNSDFDNTSESAKRVWESLKKEGLAEDTQMGYIFTPKNLKQQALQLYSQYLDSIFPDSKVKDIVYHGTKQKFEKFGTKYGFFTSSKATAESYTLYEEEKFIDLNFIKERLEEDLSTGLEPDGETPLSKEYLEEARKKLEQVNKDLEKQVPVLSIALNIKNPKYVKEYAKYDNVSEQYEEFYKAEKEGFDSAIVEEALDAVGIPGMKVINIANIDLAEKYVGKIYTVFEPEQIHILGNENDVQRFRQFVSEQGTSLQKTDEETLPSVASPETLKLVKDFLKRVGVDVNVMKEIAVNGIKYDANGVAQITQQLISVVEGKEAQALPEEAMHFAVSIIKQTNPKLYQKLMKEINGYNMLNSVFAEYGNNPLYQKDGKPDVIKLKEEAIAKVLVEKIITGVEGISEKPENLAKAQSWWRDILDWMKSLLYQRSGFDQAAIDIISGKEIGTAKDIREDNAVEFLQQTRQESLFNNIKDTSNRIDKKVDQDSAAKEERYFLDGVKKIARRVSDLTKDFFERRRKQQDLVQSEYEKAVTDLKAEKGTNGHLDFEHAFEMFVDENGYLKSPQEIELLILEDDHISFIDPNDNDIYEILRDNLLERLQAFEKDSPRTRFLKEVSIYDPSRDIAGTVDLMAITADGKINILDWKFMGLNTEKYDEIPWYKVQSWRIQMEQYKLILKNNYGVKDENFGQTRMIPILTKWSKGKPSKNILPRLTDIKIGDVVVKNISEDEGYLIPVATKGELTGNKKIDALLERLNTA
jgi:hypothetical protein